MDPGYGIVTYRISRMEHCSFVWVNALVFVAAVVAGVGVSLMTLLV